MGITGVELLTTEFKERENVWGNILVKGTFTLVYGGTGTGKSFFALSLANAIASGGSFLRWDCPQRTVLYVDGEMGMQPMQQRYAMAYNSGPEYSGQWFTLHSFDDKVHEAGRKRFPQFSDRRAWEWWDKLVSHHDVIVIDNLGTCVQEDHDARGDNEFRAWTRFREYLWKWKASGKTFVVVHHANKDGVKFSGGQKKQDDSDLTLGLHKLTPLRGPDGKQHLEMRFEKVRHLVWPQTQPLHLTFETNDNRILWTSDTMDAFLGEQIRYLDTMNMKPASIAKELKLPTWRIKQLRDVMPNAAETTQETFDYDDNELF